MESEFILSLDELRSYCELHPSDLSDHRSTCKGCSEYKKCLLLSKEQSIRSILHMEPEDSRFPAALKWLQVRPSVLWCVPAFVYKAAYGMYHVPLPCPRCSGKELLEHWGQIQEVMALLEDNCSKSTFLNILMYRLTQNSDFVLRSFSSEPEYFIEPFRNLNGDEVYVDCGAFNGDSYHSYCHWNLPPRTAYLFEPDRKNRQDMEHQLKPYQSKTELHFIGKGVYRSSGTLFFVDGEGMSSHLSESADHGGIPLAVTSLDEAILEDVSFIKMDIEGSEQDALWGAKEHILRSYPKLAICIYHSMADLWEIPLLIHKLFPEYRHFQICHHSENFTDTVLYVYR